MINKRHAIFGLAVLFVLGGSFLIKEGLFTKTQSNQINAQLFVDLQERGRPVDGYRRAHAKGICIEGHFNSNGELSPYSSAQVFKKGSYPFIGRFSIAGNNPYAPDLKAPVRSLAFSIGSDDQWRVAMNTPPFMAVATPDAFYELLSVIAPDPDTKKQSPEKISEFFAKHPESKAFLDWKTSYKASNSFATEKYHSINAFYLVDQHNLRQAVRFKAIPKTLKDEVPELSVESDDALQDQLTRILTNKEVIFDIEFILAGKGDDVNNPTQPWSADRITIVAGQLVIQSAKPQNTGPCGGVNFDPLVLPDGIQATADPILRARSAAYAESYRRRAKERLLNSNSLINEASGG